MDVTHVPVSACTILRLLRVAAIRGGPSGANQPAPVSFSLSRRNTRSQSVHTASSTLYTFALSFYVPFYFHSRDTYVYRVEAGKAG